MTDHNPAPDLTPVTVLGLGAMGTAMVHTFVDAGRPTTVWNRSGHKSAPLVAKGATAAASVTDAVTAAPLVIVCLLDYDSVHDVLDPVADALTGRVLVNVTTGTPEQAREMAAWAGERGVAYVDGGMMATPDMIGKPGASIFYSGSQAAFEQHRAVLDVVADSRFFGTDAGSASLHDLALLSAMYAMFAGFLHGAAMVGTAGVSAKEFAAMAAPWLTAMTGSLAHDAEFIDSGDYTTDVQSLDFNKSALDLIVQASRDQGVAVDVMAPVQQLIDRQVAAGHGGESFVRIFEEITQR